MMKKKILFTGVIIGAIALMSFSSFNIHNNEISLSNIEALSNEQSKEYCFGEGTLDCPGIDIKVYMLVYAR